MSAPRLSMRNGPAFGRRQPFVHAEAVAAGSRHNADVRLFLLTYLGGFLFMTIYLA